MLKNICNLYRLCHNSAMIYAAGLRWKIYLFIFVPLVVGNVIGVLDPRSAIYSYYHTLISFNAGFTLPYLLNVASALVNFFCLVPIFLFTFRIRLLRPLFWKGLFVTRIAFDLTGHSYEAKFIRSLFYIDFWYALLSIALLTAVIAPSYFACFRYAFQQNKLFVQ